ncbi:MAG TPA: DUF2249 domain-containing protein [Verrucomicrobiota bacterium]|nr:DUF2249 domain-containing protein [Verrucomicrobiota bacterium]HNT15699.1 DUF2249 domain-containing protein [Verrucomicrobiota bacterium]
MSDEIVTLDVREEISQGREPFGIIMRTVSQLQPGQKFRLLAPFEPAPLYTVLGNKGFTHETKQLDSDVWEITFSPDRASKSAPKNTAPAVPVNVNEPTSFIEVDARGLEPPQPMVTILEAVAKLPAKTGIRARTDRRPMHLYAHLEERGFSSQTTEQSDGSFLTEIRPL